MTSCCLIRSFRCYWIYLIISAICGLMTSTASAQDAADALKQSGVQGGLVVHLGCGDGLATTGLLLNDRYLVHGLDASSANVERAREAIRKTGLYGKISIDRLDAQKLPYVDNLVNVVIDQSGGSVPETEILRVLVPGGVAMIESTDQAADTTSTGWRRVDKPWSDEIDQWTHFLHGADNNAVGSDRRVNIPRSIQWVAEPRWGRSHEEMAGMNAAVTANGRIYYIVDEGLLASIRYPSRRQLVARDAFNGTLLWKIPIETWTDPLRHFRSGPAHLPRRLVAVGDRVYVTLGLDAPVVAIDGATGEIVLEYEGTERTEEILALDGVLYLVAGSSEINRRGGGLFERGEPSAANFRHVLALDAESGKMLWQRDFSKQYVLPLTLAACDGQVYFQTTEGLTCLDAASGRDLWLTPRITPAQRMAFAAPTLVATEDVVLLCDRELGKGAEGQPAHGSVQWGVHGWNEEGFSRRTKNTLTAYDVKTGEALWSADGTEGYNSPVDIFVIDNVVWVGSKFAGYDLKTGEPAGQIDTAAPRVGMPHHRCYRDKATEQFIFTSKSGIEVLSLKESRWLSNNSWIRGTCQYGIIPANGMLYAPPDACACFLTVKVPGFFAASPQREANGHMPFPNSPVLETGPGYQDATAKEEKPSDVTDQWSMYRHDASRSGAGDSHLPDTLHAGWSTTIGGRLTQPVVADGRVIVASEDAHTVFACAAADGKQLWQYTAGGRIDSSPTLYQGRVYFGSADGWVYCLHANDGSLAWRFRAAPKQQLIAAYGQLESIWPVHGSVLIQNDVLYVTAGRNSYLDGGIALYRIDPLTGKELSHNVLYHLDPDTGEQHVPENRFNMEGTTSDILVGDGDRVYLKYFGFDRDGNRIDQTEPHLFSITGLLGEEWYVRSYWLFGAGMPGAGWGGWADAAHQFPAGRILTFDDSRVYGYGRQEVSGGATGHRADAYHLFCIDRPAVAAADPASAQPGDKKRRGAQAKVVKPEPVWSNPDSLIVRAMAMGKDRLAVAGPVDVGQKAEDILAFKNEDEAVAGFEGRKGINLRIVSAKDGQTITQAELAAIPVFDGMAIASGRIYVSLKDGTLASFGQ